jgi:hypothetical protein
MRILTRGVVPETVPICTTCRHCHTVFEFLRSEGIVTVDQRNGEMVTINCPVCERVAVIHSEINKWR